LSVENSTFSPISQRHAPLRVRIPRSATWIATGAAVERASWVFIIVKILRHRGLAVSISDVQGCALRVSGPVLPRPEAPLWQSPDRIACEHYWPEETMISGSNVPRSGDCTGSHGRPMLRSSPQPGRGLPVHRW